MIKYEFIKFDSRHIRNLRTSEVWDSAYVNKFHVYKMAALIVYKGDDAVIEQITCANEEQIVSIVSNPIPASLFHNDHDFEYIRAAIDSGFGQMIVNQQPPFMMPTLQPGQDIIVKGRGPLVALAMITIVSIQD